MNLLYWREPAWLLLGLLPPLWLLLMHWRSRRQARHYADPALHPWALERGTTDSRPWRRLCLLLSWLLIGLAAAGPRTPAWLPPDQDLDGGSLMVALDLSRSMDAQDLWPSRRQRALQLLQDLAPQLVGARVGLVVFAGRAHLLLPPTTDRRALAELAGQLTDIRLPTRGSDLAGALAQARQALSDARGMRTVLLLSDLDLDASGSAQAARAMQTLSDDGIGLVLGVLASEGGAALPAADGGWLQHAGSAVISRTDSRMVATLSTAADATVLRLDGAESGVLQDALPDGYSRPRLDSLSNVVWQEHFGWLLIPAVLLWLAASLRLAMAAPAGLAAALLYLLGLTLSLPARSDTYRDAHLALTTGDAARAQQLFDVQPGFAARMGSGVSCYRLQNFSCARQAFTEALLEADSDDQRAAALYNLAHSRFQTGDYSGAARQFADALHYRPDYPAAAYNRDYARELAEEVARLAEPGTTGRTGRGPRTGTPVDDAIPAGTRLQLDAKSTESPPAVDNATSARQALLNRGLQFVQLARSQAETATGAWGSLHQGPATEADDSRLWQRLIEQTEGFPATPEQPLVITGVRPW